MYMIKDNGNLIISTSEAMAFTLKFDEYKAMTIKKDKLVDYQVGDNITDIIIVGFDIEDKKRTDIIGPNTLYEDRSIFDSLIVLSQSLTIINTKMWCAKYGFPIYDKNIYKTHKQY